MTDSTSPVPSASPASTDTHLPDDVFLKVVDLGIRRDNAEKRGHDPELYKERKKHCIGIAQGATGLAIGTEIVSLLTPGTNHDMATWIAGGGILLAVVSVVTYQLGKLRRFCFNSDTLTIQRKPPEPCVDSRELDQQIYELTKDLPLAEDETMYKYRLTPKRYEHKKWSENNLAYSG